MENAQSKKKTVNEYITAKVAPEAWMKHFKKLYTAQIITDREDRNE